MKLEVRSPVAVLLWMVAFPAGVTAVWADSSSPPAGADARDQQIWERFVNQERKAGATDRGLSSPSGPAVTGDYSSNYYPQPQSTIVVPQTFMPPVYQRPLELYSTPQPGDFSFNPRQSVGYGRSLGLWQPGWSPSTLNNLTGGIGGGLPSLGLSSLLRGFSGGGALGGFGVPSVPGGCYNFGNAWRPANNMNDMGSMGRPAVYQLQPSKPSGNYYAPSTVDSTASGSYYAQTSPSTLPVTVPKNEPGPRDYWGPQGNPFGNAFNTQPPH